MGEANATSLHALRERDPVGYARRIDEIRKALFAFIDRASLREAARGVGMSPTGLSNFLHGAEPYGRTVGKLSKWYAGHLAGGHTDGGATA